MEHVAVQTLDLSSLFEVSGRTPEEACIQVREVRCTEYFCQQQSCFCEFIQINDWVVFIK
jgi:hypothetical protein